MILKIRQRMAQEESGFTLVELLVVMLILGILAAIAIPAFFNQRNKATDSQAKTAARTAETAMETWSTDNGGVYNSPTPAVGDLQAIEETLNDGGTLQAPFATADTYTVAVQSDGPSGFYFGIHRENGQTDLICGPAYAAGTGVITPNDATPDDGCPAGGNWGS
jgi:type IV pilus assembly protein PilA